MSKQVFCCDFDSCKTCRVHHENPDVERGPQILTVEDGRDTPIFCSMTCALLAGFISIKYNSDCGIGKYETKYPNWRERWLVK